MLMTDEQAISTLEQLLNKKFSDEQLAILRTKGGLSIAAVAGSGKTTILTALITKRLLTGEIPDASKILCTTFSKTGATELGDRLHGMLTSLGLPDVKVTTIHSTCYSILKAFNTLPADLILSDSECYRLLSDAIKQALGRSVWLEPDQLEEIISAISIMDNSLITVKQLMMSGKYLLEYNEEQFTAIVTNYKNAKAATGKITYDDLLLIVHMWLCGTATSAPSEYALNYVREQFQYLFLDEFQDTNKIQFEIVKAILNTADPSSRPQDRLVVVGDDDQNVYEWRGTDPRIMINVRAVIDIKKMNLSTNYRCKSNIIQSANNCVVNMNIRQDKTMKAASEGGRVALLDTNDYKETSQYKEHINIASEIVFNHVMNEFDNMKVLPGYYCIMARTNLEMAIVANMFLRKGIILYQQAGMKLSKTRFWSYFKQIVQLSKSYTPVFRFNGVLNQLIPYASRSMEDSLNAIMTACQCTPDYALEYMLLCYRPSFADSNVYTKSDNSTNAGWGISAVPEKTKAQIDYQLTKMSSFDGIINLLNAMRSGEKALRNILILWYTAYSDRPLIHTAIKEYLLRVGAELGDAVEDYINLTETAESYTVKGIFDSRISLKTIHGSKGMEWHTVFILNDDNHFFPDFNKISHLYDNRIEVRVLKDVVDSERRLHYVAQTRAKEELYFVCNKSCASVFLEESYGYKYTDPKDANTHAAMAALQCDSENGRIIYKAITGSVASHDLQIQ